ncbi:MAG: hypothetical protein KJP00_14860, partial [Bacteroidia bacterium]|nr:hypothetical protein [Bacteroidia bacterium]
MYPLFRNFLFRKELVFSISFILYTSFVSIGQQNASFCPPFAIGVNHDCEDGNDLPAVDVKLYRT